MSPLRISLCAILFAAGLAAAPSLAGAELECPDLEGHLHQPLRAGTNRATVLIFILTDCPVANSYVPEINRIISDFSGKGVRFYLVHVDPDLNIDEARQHARDFNLTCPVLLDRKHLLVRHAGATITPEAVVFMADGRRIYRGRIDNRQAALNKRRPRATHHDLRDALDALLAGRRVKVAETKAIGCYIPSPGQSKQ